MLTPPGKTNLAGVPSSLRLQPARLAVLVPVLTSSIQSGVVPALVSAPVLSASTSLIRTEPGGGTTEIVPGVPLTAALRRQLAGSSGSPAGSFISIERPSRETGQPLRVT